MCFICNPNMFELKTRHLQHRRKCFSKRTPILHPDVSLLPPNLYSASSEHHNFGVSQRELGERCGDGPFPLSVPPAVLDHRLVLQLHGSPAGGRLPESH